MQISPAAGSGGSTPVVTSCFGGGEASDTKETRTHEHPDKIESEKVEVNQKSELVAVSVIEVNDLQCATGQDPEMGFTRNEARRSKSRMRAYFRRCKEAITGSHHSNSGQNATILEANPSNGDDVSIASTIASSHEPVSQTPIWSADQKAFEDAYATTTITSFKEEPIDLLTDNLASLTEIDQSIIADVVNESGIILNVNDIVQQSQEVRINL